MRQTILKWAAAFAVLTASAAPALACGGGFGTGCSPCGARAYVSPCAQGYGYAGVAAYERLPDPVHQYYYANQGPTFTGPGNFAPYPTYQETAVSGWSGYARGDVGYDGGPYGNATNHYSWAQPAYRGPVIYSYRPRAGGYHSGVSRQVRYAYAPQRSYGARYGYASPRGYAPRYGYAPQRGQSYRYGQQSRHHARPQVIYGNGRVGPSRNYRQDTRRGASRVEAREALGPPVRMR